MPSPPRASRFLLGFAAVLAVLGLLIVRPFMSGIVFALVLGFLLQRPYRFLLRHLRKPGLAAGVLVPAALLLVCVPLVVLAWRLFVDIESLVANLDSTGLWTGIVGAAHALGLDEAAARQFVAGAQQAAVNTVRDNALGTLAAFGRFLTNLGVFVFLLFYVLIAGPRLLAAAAQAVPLSATRSRELLADIGNRVRALFLGTFLVAAIQGGLAGLAWWVLGFPSPVLWTFLMTILAVIPAVGPAIVMVPAGLLAIVAGRLGAGVGLIVWGVVVVGFVDNLARPYIIGRNADVHPALVLLGTLGGIALFGAPGFILGPLALSLLPPVLEQWREESGAAR